MAPTEFPAGVSAACELTCVGQEGGEALPFTFLRPALSAMRPGCEPSTSFWGLSLDGSDPSLGLV